MASSVMQSSKGHERASPPPLPDEPIPDEDDAEGSGEAQQLPDEPINSLGTNDEEEEDGDENDEEAEDEAEDEDDEQEDPGEDDARTETSAEKAKRKGKGTAGAAVAASGTDAEQPWQAVWSAESNAWYFWNTKTSEVTWTNPLQPAAEDASSEPAPPPLPPGPAPEAETRQPDASFGLPPDIDPELAHLLPPSQRGGPGGGPSGAQTALFNSRTGRFTPADYSYTVDHLNEYNRSKRMNSHYFDVEAWEKTRAEETAKRKRDEAAGVGSNNKPTRQDMQRYKKKALEKKHRSQAWLRD